MHVFPALRAKFTLETLLKNPISLSRSLPPSAVLIQIQVCGSGRILLSSPPIPKPSLRAMLRVFKVSGEIALAIPFEEFLQIACLNNESATVLDVKRHLQRSMGQPRFRQCLVLPDGRILSDHDVLGGPTDVQLALLQFEACSDDQIRHLQQTAQVNDIAAMERLLQRPQDPDLQLDGSSRHVAAAVFKPQGCCWRRRLA